MIGNRISDRLAKRFANVYRLELQTKAKVTRSHIPISRRSLIRKILEKFPEYEHEKLLALFSEIDATVQNNSRPYTLQLKDLYDPLNPDKDTIRIRADLSYSEQQEALMRHLRPLLAKAKYEKLPTSEINRLSAYVELPERGLQVKTNVKDYALAEIWFKGEASIEATRRLDWENMSLLKQFESYYYELIDIIRRKFTKHIQTQAAKVLRATPMDDDYQYQRLIIVLRKRNTSKLIIKSFKFIPKGGLQVLFPETTKRMGSLNSVIMYSTVFGSLATIFHNFFVGTSSAFMWPLCLLIYRFWYNYDYRKKRYDSTIASLLYHNNLGNNVGVILEIIDRAESEAFTSSILLYSALLHDCSIAKPNFDTSGRTVEEVDLKIERWILEFLGFRWSSSDVDLTDRFDETAATENLLKFGMIDLDNDTRKIYIKPLDETIEFLKQKRLNRKLVYSKSDINDTVNSLYIKKKLGS